MNTMIVRIAPILLLLGVASASSAQMAGLPILQNAFGNPGFTVAGNAGFGSGGTTFGVAAGWSPGSGRFRFAGGAGLYTPENGDGRGAWGLRASASLLSAMGGSLGVGVFGGAGGAGRGGAKAGTPAVDAPNPDAFSLIPVGASIGYRLPFGGQRGISLYASPSFVWYSSSTSGSDNTGLVRVAVGADIGLSASFGVTVGAEFGQNGDEDTLAPRGTLVGVGLSFVPGRR